VGFAGTNASGWTSFSDDSIYVNGTVYTPIGSLSVIQDTVTNILFFVTGDVELSQYDKLYLALATDTTSAGVPELVVGGGSNDTTTVTAHYYWWKPKYGDPEMRIPFTFVQELTSDSLAGAVLVRLLAKVESANFPVILKNVRIDCLTNVADE